MSHSEDNNHFDDQMRDRLEHSEMTPPPELWDKIEEELPPSLPLFLKFRNPAIAAIWTFCIISLIFIYQKFDYAYKLNQFMTETLIENDHISNSNDIYISGLNISTLAKLGKYHEEIKNKRLLAKTSNTQKSPNQTFQTFEGSSFSVNPQQQNEANNSTNHSYKDQLSSHQQGDQTINRRQKRLINKKFHPQNTRNKKSQEPTSEVDDLPSNQSIQDIGKFDHKLQSLLELEPIIVCEIQDDETNPYQNSKQKVIKKTNFQRNKGFYIGPMVGAHYTAMTLSSKEGINTSKMDQTPTFGTTYGISLGYILNNRWSFGMEWIYNSSEGQRFEGEFKGKETRKYVKLDYFKLPFYAKYRQQFLPHNKKVKTSINYLAGIHYSKLKNRNTFINGEIEAFNIDHNKHQWGMMLGAEIDIYPTEKIFFTLGARGVFNADIQKLPTIRGPHNTDPFSVQTGIYAKVHYVFTKGK